MTFEFSVYIYFPLALKSVLKGIISLLFLSNPDPVLFLNSIYAAYSGGLINVPAAFWAEPRSTKVPILFKPLCACDIQF